MEADLSKRLRYLRLALDLTQSALAERVGITQAYLAELEKGIKRPSLDVLEKLCDALSCSADYLLGLSDDRGYRPLREEGLAGRGITPELLREVYERNVTGRELRLALDFVKTMQDENAKK
jgi:transcriptional regulator with XRE-family HTH domain